MQQLTYVKPGELVWDDVPEPQLDGPMAALVRPVAVATCDLDAAIIRGQSPVPGPFPFGHECVARVTAVGEAVRGVTVGQMVALPFQISCGTCARCTSGMTGDCTSVRARACYGLGRIGGAEWGSFMSDVVRVPFADAMLVPLPDGIAPTAVASISDNLPDAWRTVAPYLAETPGADVLIMGGGGGGSIGLYAAAMARALGAGRVDYVDRDPARLAVAQSFGANPIDGLPKRLGPYPVTVDASANADALGCALRSTDTGGICTSIGIYYTPPALPLIEMYTTGITFKTGRPHARTSIPAILALVADGRLHPEAVTTETAAWHDAPAALTTFHTKLIISRD